MDKWTIDQDIDTLLLDWMMQKEILMQDPCLFTLNVESLVRLAASGWKGIGTTLTPITPQDTWVYLRYSSLYALLGCEVELMKKIIINTSKPQAEELLTSVTALFKSVFDHSQALKVNNWLFRDCQNGLIALLQQYSLVHPGETVSDLRTAETLLQSLTTSSRLTAHVQPLRCKKQISLTLELIEKVLRLLKIDYLTSDSKSVDSFKEALETMVRYDAPSTPNRAVGKESLKMVFRSVGVRLLARVMGVFKQQMPNFGVVSLRQDTILDLKE